MGGEGGGVGSEGEVEWGVREVEGSEGVEWGGGVRGEVEWGVREVEWGVRGRWSGG